MQRCETCKHWRSESKVNYGGQMHECRVIQGGAFGAPPAMTYDGDGAMTYGFLATMPDFGCTLHTPKEAANGTNQTG